MQPWKSILTILDKPKHAQTALTRSLEFQAQTDAHLHLVSFCWTPMRESRAVLDPGQRLALENALVEQRRGWIHHEVHRQTVNTDTSTEVVFTEDIAAWVADEVPKTDRDLVVKSVHHSETLLHTPLDWQLIRTCPVPVMLCADRQRKRSGNILVSIDMRHEDPVHQALNRKVLETASYVAKSYGAQIHCVYAIEFSEVLSDLDIIDRRQVEARAKEKLTPALADLVAPFGVEPDNIHMQSGKVGHVVAGVAYQLDADLLVLGTIARAGVRGMLIGNSAERVLTKAPCDVLTVGPDPS